MLKKILSLGIATLIVGACAMQPGLNCENPASVTFNFQSENNKNAMTFWRKIESDGTKGSRFMLGQSTGSAFMNMNFPEYYPETRDIDPGTYYLDSYQVAVSSKPGIAYCVSQGGHYMTRNGWDDENNQPLYISFTVSEGEQLNLPMVKFDAECQPTITGDTSKVKIGSKFK